MAVVCPTTAVSLGVRGHYVSRPVAIHAQTATLHLRLERPSPTTTVTWDAQTAVRVTLCVKSGTEIYRATGDATGGPRTRKHRGQRDVAQDAYLLSYTLPHGFFGVRGGFPRRLGEGSASHRAWLEIEVLKGSGITSAVSVTSDVRPSDLVRHHSSVAFDTASGTFETSGDGICSWSHTASGSNRAALVGTFIEFSTTPDPTASSATYAGNALDSSAFTSAGNYTSQWLAGHVFKEAKIPTGSQTVTATVTGTGSKGDHGAGVVTMTGVDQTTPVGSAPTADKQPSGTTPSVPVLGVGASDLVVDVLGCFVTSGAITAGADQTAQTTQTSGGYRFGMSTQLGSNGGVMSWSKTSGNEYALNAVAFKPSGGTAFMPRPNTPTLQAVKRASFY